MAADNTVQPKTYRRAGGDETVIADGGKLIIESGGIITEEAGGAILGRAVLTANMADVGTAGSTFVVCPFAGTVVSLAAVSSVQNAGTKTVLTSKIAGSAITHPAWELAVTLAAGTASTVVPTAANTVVAGNVIEIISDGGSTAVQPTIFAITVLRTS